MTNHNVRRHIALVAHDNKKAELLNWAEFNRETLREHHLYATGTTGTLLEFEHGLPITHFLSGPVGGDLAAPRRLVEHHHRLQRSKRRLRHLVATLAEWVPWHAPGRLRPVEPCSGREVYLRLIR